MKRKKLVQLAFTITSAIAVAAINYTILHNTFIFIILLVLLAHEMGHYFVAKKHKAEPSLPIFLPLPFLIIAATKIKPPNKISIKHISLAGPLTGALTALLLLAFSILYKTIFLPTKYILILFIQEIIFNYFGSDGKKYRNATLQ